MISPSKKTPILIIDDEPEHCSAIYSRFQGEFYEPEYFDLPTNDRLLNYKALHQDNQIVIVDLNLQERKDGGFAIIKNYLWPADRTTFFVIFSKHEGMVAQMDVKEVQPHWTFVSKLLEQNGSLTQRCLDDLFNVVDTYRMFCNPFLSTPTYSTKLLCEQIDQLYQDNSCVSVESRPRLTNTIINSVTVLNECAEAATAFNRAGMCASKIGIGIYGSYGRLEARPDSDIEFSVFYENDPESPCSSELRTLPTIFWNRMMMFMVQKNWKVEGMDSIKKNDPPVLRYLDATDEMPNAYCYTISVDSLLRKNLQTESHIRNRHLQILTELQPIFNRELFFNIKRSLITNYVGNVPQKAAIFNHPYFYDMFSQFFMDTRPAQIHPTANYKKFCYRILHLFSLRICLMHHILFEKKFFEHSDEWEHFFESFSSPGIHKVIRFTIEAKRKLKNESGRSPQRFITLLDEFTRKYIDTIDCLFILCAQRAKENKSITDSDWSNELKLPVKQCIEKFINILESVSKIKPFAPLADVSWLLKTDDIKRFSERL